MIEKLNKPYNSVYEDYFSQFPQKTSQKQMYFKNSANEKFGNRMMVCAVCTAQFF